MAPSHAYFLSSKTKNKQLQLVKMWYLVQMHPPNLTIRIFLKKIQNAMHTLYFPIGLWVVGGYVGGFDLKLPLQS